MALKKSKAESRQERMLQKRDKNEQKNVRFALGISPFTKSIRLTWKPSFEKSPRLVFPIDNYKDTTFSWCVTRADTEGDWSWGESRGWRSNEYEKEIESHFNNLSNNTWKEIETQTYNGADGHRKLLNKYQTLDSICDEAQERWINDPDLAQFEQLFRFRRGTNKRIWGVRVYHHFFTIWYERKHKICPIEND
jgi:hypothetical protein